MRIDHLKYIKAIEKYRSITLAAQHLYLGQTTLNTIVRNMERELGFTIFQRGIKGLQPTENGEAFLQLAGEILICHEKIVGLKNMEERRNTPISILTPSSAIGSFALSLCSKFRKDFPQCELEFLVASSSELVNLLVSSESKIGLAYIADLDGFRKSISRYHFQVTSLLEDHMYLLVHRDHPYASLSSINCQDITGQSIVFMSHMNQYENFSTYFKLFGKSNRYHAYPSLSLILQAVTTQNMVAVVNGYSAITRPEVESGLLKPIFLSGIGGSATAHLCLIHKDKSDLTFDEKKLVQYIYNHFKAHLMTHDQ